MKPRQCSAGLNMFQVCFSHLIRTAYSLLKTLLALSTFRRPFEIQLSNTRPDSPETFCQIGKRDGPTPNTITVTYFDYCPTVHFQCMLLRLIAVGTMDLPDNFDTRSVVYLLFFIFSWRSVRAIIKSAFSSAICQETRLTPKFSANTAPTQLQRGMAISNNQTRMTPWYFAHADTCRTTSTTDEVNRWTPIIHTESILCWTSRKHQVQTSYLTHCRPLVI